MNQNPFRRQFRRSFLPSLTSRLPIFLWIIIATSIISIVGFVFFSFLPSSSSYFALSPKAILQGQMIWTIVTHIFFHANFFHLFVNMFSLFFIGSITEAIIGKKRILGLYLIAGVLAGVFFVFLAYLGSATGFTSVLGDINIEGVGSSGALFGLLGVLAVLIPKKKVYLIAGPIILIILQVVLQNWISGALLNVLDVIISLLIFMTLLSLVLPIPLLRKLALQIEMSLWLAPIAAIVPLVLISFYISLPIGNSAHLGGLLVGLVYGFYLRLKYPKKVMLIERYFR